VPELALTRTDGLTLSNDPARLDIDRVAGWLAQSYWAADRDRSTIERSIAGSQAYGVFSGPDQIAFARAVTDFATFCWIADVVVEPAYRGRGIGTWLVSSIVEDVAAAGVQRLVLATRDAHGVYRRLGFDELRVPATWMEIDRRVGRPNPEDVVVRATNHRAARESTEPAS
jgi:GNAT superfamily N-acetyltransferase